MAVATVHAIKDATIGNISWWNWYIYQDGTRSSSQIGFWDWDDKPWDGFYAYQARTLQQYSLPILPVDATIISAKLKIYMREGSAPGSWNQRHVTIDQNPTVEIHRILQDWDEGAGTGFVDGYQYSGATWTNRKANGSGWLRSGGYFDSVPVASKQQPRNSGWWEFDIKSMVDYWYANPKENFGLMVKYKDDDTPRGGMWMHARENSFKAYSPVIEITYNTPPEKPRGLSPNFGSFICQDLAHSMHFKWSFIDTAAPPAYGKADIVFLVDVSGSMHWNLSKIKSEIGRYIDRLDQESVDWQIGLVAFSDIRVGEQLRKYGWFNSKNALYSAYDSMPRLYGGDWPESGLEAIMDSANGALSFSFRDQSKVHFVICTDAPFHNKSGIDTGYYYANYSIYEFQNVVDHLKSRGIICSINANTHCASYTQLHGLPRQTGGQYMDEYSGWGNSLKIHSIKSEDEMARYDEGDSQSRAVLRVFEIEPNGNRAHIWTQEVSGETEDFSLKGVGVPWKEGASYEWDVQTYDQHGVPSPWSDRAKFTYIIDVNALVGIPMFNEPLVVGESVNKKALLEIRTRLYDEVRKYRNMDPAEVLTLFNGEVVPSKDDMLKLKSLLDRIAINDGVEPTWGDLIGDTFGVSDIENIRNKLVDVSYSPPDNPPGGTAKWSDGVVHRPISIASNHDSNLDTTIDVKWTPAEVTLGGWIVDLGPSKDTDINYYKLFHQEVVNYGIKPEAMLTEVYMKSEQVIDGTIFVPSTGRTDSQRMWYTSHDMNGRVSHVAGNVAFGGVAVDQSKTVSHYVVEYQQRYWTSNQPDPQSIWYQVYAGGGTSFTHAVSAEGSYWYRVKAVLSDGQSTDWTYSVDHTYIKY